MKKITDKQQLILDYIKQHIESEGYPPTVREIGAAFSITAKAAFDHLRALEKKGVIRSGRRRSRAIELVGAKPTFVQIPLLGRIAAGTPIVAEENVEEMLTFPQTMFEDNGPFFAVRVQGDSMKDTGIWDNDLAIIRQQNCASNGDVIAALIGDEATLKYFSQKGEKVALHPANEDYPVIYPNLSDFSILGKLIGTYSVFSGKGWRIGRPVPDAPATPDEIPSSASELSGT